MTDKHQKESYHLEVIKQGYQISHEMKMDIMELYQKSIQQDHFSHKSDYIRHHLEEKYGRCFSIIIYNSSTFLSHSFLHSDDYLLELKSSDHHILAYLLPPTYQPPPLLKQPVEVRRSYSPVIERPYASRIVTPQYGSRIIEPTYYPYNAPLPQQSYYGSRYYDGYYRRGYGYW